jgi:hypothetical protein
MRGESVVLVVIRTAVRPERECGGQDGPEYIRSGGCRV